MQRVGHWQGLIRRGITIDLLSKPHPFHGLLASRPVITVEHMVTTVISRIPADVTLAHNSILIRPILLSIRSCENGKPLIVFIILHQRNPVALCRPTESFTTTYIYNLINVHYIILCSFPQK